MISKTFAQLAADEAFYDIWGNTLVDGNPEATLRAHIDAKVVIFEGQSEYIDERYVPITVYDYVVDNCEYRVQVYQDGSWGIDSD
jgi:hypothetical protein